MLARLSPFRPFGISAFVPQFRFQCGSFVVFRAASRVSSICIPFCEPRPHIDLNVDGVRVPFFLSIYQGQLASVARWGSPGSCGSCSRDCTTSREKSACSVTTLWPYRSPTTFSAYFPAILPSKEVGLSGAPELFRTKLAAQSSCDAPFFAISLFWSSL